MQGMVSSFSEQIVTHHNPAVTYCDVLANNIQWHGMGHDTITPTWELVSPTMSHASEEQSVPAFSPITDPPCAGNERLSSRVNKSNRTVNICYRVITATWYKKSQAVRVGLAFCVYSQGGGAARHTCTPRPKCRKPELVINLLVFALSPLPLSSDRQHLSYDVCLEVRGEIIRTVLCCIVYWSSVQSKYT